ncbi:hypothetical protein COTS27_01421 [Spirochaetota bacterium]|nr:hypothetical protein COTS27_01421 [Spirochaetota bacterium]
MKWGSRWKRVKSRFSQIARVIPQKPPKSPDPKDFNPATTPPTTPYPRKSAMILQRFKGYPRFYLVLALIGGLTLSYIGVLVISARLNLYGLEVVKIIGVNRLHPYELLETLNLQKGTPLLTLNTVTLEQTLKARPQIKRVQIRKKYPHTLKITIEEHIPYFLVKTPLELYAITAYGEILFSGNRIQDHDHFIIEVETEITASNLSAHKEVGEFLAYFNDLAESEKDILALFSGIHFGKEILMFAKNEQITFKLGRKLSLQQLKKARYAYLYKKQKNIKKSTVDLRFNFVRYTS